MRRILRQFIAIASCIVYLLSFYACTPVETQQPAPTLTLAPTWTPSPTATLLPSLTPTLTPSPGLTPTRTCERLVHGTYNFPRRVDETFSLGPGRHLFYDAPGGGKYGHDQAGCELNADCTQLRATNKDSADPNPEGVLGPWVDIDTGTSLARWNQYVVQCRAAP